MSVQYLRPILAVLVNIPCDSRGGRLVSGGSDLLKDCLVSEGFMVDSISPIQSADDLSGYTLIKFGSTEDHCISAFKLQRIFENYGRSWLSWNLNAGGKSGLHLWVAKSSDREYISGPAVYAPVPLPLRLRGRELGNADSSTILARLQGMVDDLYYGDASSTSPTSTPLRRLEVPTTTRRQYVTPYTVIITNIPANCEGPQFVSTSLTSVKDCLVRHGFLVDRVRPMWCNEVSGKYVLVEFGVTDDHGRSAFKLQKMFDRGGQGWFKWTWYTGEKPGIHLWVASSRDVEYFQGGTCYATVPLAVRVEGGLSGFEGFSGIISDLQQTFQSLSM